MKCLGSLALLHVLLAPPVFAKLEASPVRKVLIFIEELKAEITADMEKENASFTTFQDWCNETISTATANVASGEAAVETLTRRIEELSGFEAAGGAEIANAEKTLAENAQRQVEAVNVREQEAKAYQEEAAELNASLAAMDDALVEMDPSADGTKIAGFLQKGTGPGRGIRQLLKSKSFNDKVAKVDLQALSDFVSGGRKQNGQQFMQLERGDINGDYNSATDQVVNIIKQTQEDFEKERTELADDEAEKTKVHKSLVGSLMKEKADLEAFLTEQKANEGNSAKELSDKKVLRDETALQLKADRKLLTSTEDTCKEKSYQFSARTKLRQQELAGVSQALDILGSDNSTKVFENSGAIAFTQLRKARASEAGSAQEVNRQKAYQLLQATARNSHDFSLARLAVEVQNTGAFDTVIAKIDEQVKRLKDEGKEDVEHRDRCLQQMSDSDASLASLEDVLAKTQTKIERMESRETEIEAALAALDQDIKATEKDIDDRQASRDEERAEHLEALKHDEDALELLESALEQLTKFFKKKKIPVGASLVQTRAARDKEQPGKMPDAGFDDADYRGAKDSTTGVVGMMQMVKEDVIAEIENGKADDAENQELYEKDYKAMKELLVRQQAKQLSSNKALAELQEDTEAKKEFQDSKTDEKSVEQTNKANLEIDCAWVKTNFQSRRDKRKAEIDGLVEAKGLLLGAEP